nr:MAG TPA: hypothetical protein [Caudoviricetes sp.]
MPKSILVLDGKTTVAGGTAGQNAVMSVTHTATVSNTEDLTPGAACSAKIETVLWVEPGEKLSVTSGTKIEYYRESADQRKLVGTFWAVKPTKQSRNTYKVFAYDAVSKLDKNLSVWLRSIQTKFPMSLWAFAELVAQKCGLEIANDTLPRNADYKVHAFYADNLTGRELLGWTAQACGTFLRATPEGKLEFAWYRPAPIELGIGPGDGVSHIELRLAGKTLRTVSGQIWRFGQKQIGYCQGSLQYEDYDTAPIDKVQIKQSEDDVGVIWPQDAAGTNALVIQENLLLVSDTADALRPVAQALYEELKNITYRPCKLELFGEAGFTAGDVVAVTDAHGCRFETYIMTATVSGGKSALECTGNARRDSVSAVNQQRYTNLKGKLLEIRTDIDGLNVKASDLSGGLTQLNLTVDGLKTTVSGKLDGQDAQTLIDQNLAGLTLSASAGDQSTTLTLKAGQTTLTSASITFTGFVAFEDLSTAGRTTINGANLRTGVVLSNSGYTRLDLDSGVFQVGKDNTVYVHLEPDGITWRGGQDVDGATAHGQIRATEDRLWVTSDTRYQMFGWRHEASGTYQCLEMEQVDNAVSVPNRLNVGGVCSVRTLLAWDAKERVVQTETWGSRGMAAMESPEPLFFDAGSGVLDENGVCCIEAAPVYEEVTSPTVERRWYVTPTAEGTLWVEKTRWGAVVHGTPGLSFDWMVGSVQRGYEGVYAEVYADPYPEVSCKPGDFLNEEVLEEVFGPILQTEREESK